MQTKTEGKKLRKTVPSKRLLAKRIKISFQAKQKQEQGEEKPRTKNESPILIDKPPKKSQTIVWVIFHLAVEWSQPERAAVLLYSQLPMQLSLKLTSAASQVFHPETEIQRKAQKLLKPPIHSLTQKPTTARIHQSINKDKNDIKINQDGAVRKGLLGKFHLCRL